MLSLSYQRTIPGRRLTASSSHAKRAYQAVISNGKTWYVGSPAGRCYESAYIRGEVYHFNPVLHLPEGEYRVELCNGWPRFEPVGD